MAGGRPSAYQTKFNQQAYKLALLGATDKEMADFFEVAESTFHLWKLDHPKFSEAINKGKIKADAEVANSLFKRATGFEYDEVTFEKVGDQETVTMTTAGEIKAEQTYRKKVVTKFVPPDVAAQNIWLKNRRSKARVDKGAFHWADKQEVGLTDDDGANVQPFLLLPTDKLKQIEQLLHETDQQEAAAGDS